MSSDAPPPAAPIARAASGGSGARATEPGGAGRRSASGRRLRYGLSSLAIIVCASISLALANLISLDPRLRVIADVTATGEHRLAPRTQQVIASLPAGYEIVIAGASATDSGVRRRVADVLDAMARTNRLTISWIDDPSGPEYAALIRRLIERDRVRLDAAAGSLTTSADELETAATLLDRVSGSLGDIESAIANSASASGTAGAPGVATARRQLTEYAGVARVLGTDARAAAQSIRGALGEPSALGVPPLDRAASVARRSLTRLATELSALSSAMTLMASSESTPPEAVLRARGLIQQLTFGRDPIALAADRATGLAVPDLVRVARVLEGSQAVIVVSPTGLTAVAFDTLFPASIPETVGGARADIGAQSEDLLASALATLASPSAPIVVLLHAEDGRLLDQNALSVLLARLALRRIDVVEWRVMAEPEPLGLGVLNPDNTRPIVYVALGTSYAAGASGTSNSTGPDRVQKLGATLRRLAGRGLPMLVSIAPSPAPAFGGTDEATAVLADFGLGSDSGRPLLTSRIVNGRRQVQTDRLVTAVAASGAPGRPSPEASAGTSPILDATAGLAIGLQWVTPLEARDPPAGVRAAATPLIEVGTPDTWGESQWLQYFQVPPDQRARVTQPPTPDNDQRDDVTGPWTIAFAVERTVPGLPRAQRLVAIGSNGWFFDAIAAQSEVVNGRVVPTLPGNAELFEASVYWLANQDDFIARSAASGSVPTVRALSPTESTIINWLVLAILPLGTLAVGVMWRMTRG